MTATGEPLLFTPFDLGRHRLKNRIVNGSISTRMGDRGRITDRLIRFHQTRAQGGAAMIVTEAMAVGPTAAEASRVWPFDPANADALKRWAAAVESEGCRFLGQLWHNGRARLTGRATNAIGAAAEADGVSWTVPHELSADEVRALTEEFVGTARRLQDAGFSGVELSSCHGFLIHQFLSPWSNTREDEYGGSRENRLRFLVDIITGIRQTCGDDFLIGAKMPGDDGVPGSVDPEESEQLVKGLLGRVRPDYLCFSQGNHAHSLEMHAPAMQRGVAPFLPLYDRLRAAAGDVPVVAVGRLPRPEDGEQVLQDGRADLIMLSRPLLADPAWVDKAASGRGADIRLCIGCNTCWGEIIAGRQVGCVVNPRVGRADEVAPPPKVDTAARRILVAGAGPAGLEAAWVAASRGHEVHLFASGELGGAAALHARLPGSADVGWLVDGQVARIRQAGVRIHRAAADMAAFESLGPDAVVLATGSAMVRPRSLDATSRPGEDLRSLVRRLLADEGAGGRHCLVFDFDHGPATYAALELIAQRFGKVTMLTPRASIAQDVPLVVNQIIHRRLRRLRNLEIVPFAQPVAWNGQAVDWIDVMTGDEGRTVGVDCFGYATPRKPIDALAKALAMRNIPMKLVGDAYAPRMLLSATSEGHLAGEAA